MRNKASPRLIESKSASSPVALPAKMRSSAQTNANPERSLRYSHPNGAAIRFVERTPCYSARPDQISCSERCSSARGAWLTPRGITHRSLECRRGAMGSCRGPGHPGRRSHRRLLGSQASGSATMRGPPPRSDLRSTTYLGRRSSARRMDRPNLRVQGSQVLARRRTGGPRAGDRPDQPRRAEVRQPVGVEDPDSITRRVRGTRG